MRVRSSPLLQPLLQLLLAGLKQNLQPASIIESKYQATLQVSLAGPACCTQACVACTLCQLSAAGACSVNASMCCSLCSKQL